MKSTLCLIENGTAQITGDFGSLDTPDATKAYEKTARDILASASPARVAHDLHPDFFSTRLAQSLGLQAVPVQHHHAHIAAVMAEHGVKEPVLGLALDGFGLGDDGGSWGGELLRVDPRGFTRLGHLHLLPQPGGDVAAREPWRMGAAALWAMGHGEEIAARYKAFPNAHILKTMMERGLNCPSTSSAGRLFDAACGLLGVNLVSKFEGEAPMALESLVREPICLEKGWSMGNMDSPLILDLRPLLTELTNRSPAEGADLFHGTLIAALAEWLRTASEQTGLRTVAFGGGCFFNKVLCRGLAARMDDLKMRVLWPQAVSPGDAAISLGQAYAAALAMETEGT